MLVDKMCVCIGGAMLWLGDAGVNGWAIHMSGTALWLDESMLFEGGTVLWMGGTIDNPVLLLGGTVLSGAPSLL